MTDQLDLFDAPTARMSDPETSHMAAVISIGQAASNRTRALAVLKDAGEYGMTDFELSAATGVAQTSIGVRRGELVKAGLVVRRVVVDPKTLHLVPSRRPAPSGAPSAVWCVASAQHPSHWGGE